MRRVLLVAAGVALAALASFPVAAQDSAQTFTNNSNSTSNSFSRNESYERIDNRGIPRQAPALGLGNIYGLNPCATGVSVGVTTPLVGVGGAFSTIDSECQTRNNAAIAVSALRDEAIAREIMCTVPRFREAALRVGRPCIQDGGVALVLPSSAPAGSNNSGDLPGKLDVPRGAVQLPADAMPPRTFPGSGTNGDPRLRSESGVPTPPFCNLPGLARRMYPECNGEVAASAGAQAALPRDTSPRARRTQRPYAEEGSTPPRTVDRPPPTLEPGFRRAAFQAAALPREARMAVMPPMPVRPTSLAKSGMGRSSIEPKPDNQRCRDVVMRASLGEEISGADRSLMRAGCARAN